MKWFRHRWPLLAVLTLWTLVWLSSCKESKETKDVSTREQKPPPDWLSKSYLMGRFDPHAHPLFDTLPNWLSSKEDLVLRREALNALLKMIKDLQKEGLTITVHSATRNFDYQRRIWERKWYELVQERFPTKNSLSFEDSMTIARTILRWSSMPGTSRHHWGTEIDINSFDNSYFETGEGQRLYQWLRIHAPSYGFCQPYTAKDSTRPYGYEEERWHWSYMPLSQLCTQWYADSVYARDIRGFVGDNMVDTLQIIRKYVLGIAPNCREDK